MTVCSKCGVAKTAANTAAMATAADGLQTHCRECKAAYGRAWRAANRAEHLRRVERWREEHPEKHRAYQRAWWDRNPDGVRQKSTRRRARQADAFREDVDRLVLLERDDGVCGICGGDVDPFGFHIDHIVPLALGGEHSYANAQVAHPACNIRKGAYILALDARHGS